jgi:hypothetical protein
MKITKLLGLASALSLTAMPVLAQDANPQIKQLQEQLRQMQEQHQRQMETLQKQIEALQRQHSEVAAEQQKLKAAVPETAAANPVEDAPWRPTDPIRIRRGQAYLDIGLVGTMTAGASTARDIDRLQTGGHDPNQRGFTLQGVEATFSGAVDPYFRGLGTLGLSLDPDGDTRVELEEGWLESTSLPGNLQLRAGQMYSEFGRHNPLHLHAWSFVDSPIINARLLGPDGLRNPGARLSWLMPTPFYSELFLGVQNSGGGTAASFRSEGHAHGGDEEEGIPFAFRHGDNDRGLNKWSDLLFTPRYAVSFNLTDSQTLLLGTSAALGPNSRGGAGSGELDTRIYGTDVTWKWKSRKHEGGFPFVLVQAEGMLRKHDVGAFDWDEDGNGGDGDGDGFVDQGLLVDPGTGLPAILGNERLTDYGLYAQMLYGFRKGWVAGVRYDYAAGTRGAYENAGLIVADGAGAGDPAGLDLFRSQRHRFSPNLTWYPTEFSKIRLQYNYDHREALENAHSVWMQFEFALGAHAAHKF